MVRHDDDRHLLPLIPESRTFYRLEWPSPSFFMTFHQLLHRSQPSTVTICLSHGAHLGWVACPQRIPPRKQHGVKIECASEPTTQHGGAMLPGVVR